MTQPEVSLVVRQVLAGLQYLHERNIMHRDIGKLSNLYIDDDFCIKIGCLGKAALAVEKEDKFSSIYWPDSWLAPEMIDDGVSYTKV